MKAKCDRRTFLRASGLAGLAAGMAGDITSFAAFAAEHSKRKEKGTVKFHKAVITGPPDEALLKKIKEAGLDGVEVNLMGVEGPIITREEAAKVRATAEKIGVRIHSVLRGWAEYNSPDPAKVKADQEYTMATMRAAQGYGADEILLVPGRIGGMKMPDRDKFKVKFDPSTGHLTQVAEGDNTPYKDYIAAHDKAWDAFQVSVKELIPLAKETGVIIAIENVWNNMFLSPEIFTAFVDSFRSQWVKAYFDVANHLVYGPPPQDWIKVLGNRICKIHIKDYRLNPPDGNEWPSLRGGNVDFPKVIAALKEVGYDGWLTVEGPPEDFRECSRLLDEIIAGK